MLKPVSYKALLLIILSWVVNACTLISPTINKAKYNRVEAGMTSSQVQDIIGKPGEASAEVSLNISSVSVTPDVSNQAMGVKPAVYQ